MGGRKPRPPAPHNARRRPVRPASHRVPTRYAATICGSSTGPASRRSYTASACSTSPARAHTPAASTRISSRSCGYSSAGAPKYRASAAGEVGPEGEADVRRRLADISPMPGAAHRQPGPLCRNLRRFRGLRCRPCDAALTPGGGRWQRFQYAAALEFAQVGADLCREPQVAGPAGPSESSRRSSLSPSVAAALAVRRGAAVRLLSVLVRCRRRRGPLLRSPNRSTATWTTGAVAEPRRLHLAGDCGPALQ